MQLGGETPARGPLSKQLTLSALLAKTRANTSNMGRECPQSLSNACSLPAMPEPPALARAAPGRCISSHARCIPPPAINLTVPPLVGREPSCLARLPTASLSLAAPRAWPFCTPSTAPIDELPQLTSGPTLLYHESHKSVPTAPHWTRPLLPLTSRDVAAAPTAPPLAFWNHVLHNVPDR